MCNFMKNYILILFLLTLNSLNAQSDSLNLSTKKIYSDVLKYYIEKIEYSQTNEIYLVDNSNIIKDIPSLIEGFTIKNLEQNETSLNILKQNNNYIPAINLSDLKIENGFFYVEISDVFIKRNGKKMEIKYSDFTKIKAYFKINCDNNSLEFTNMTFE